MASIHSIYCENLLVLSVAVRASKHQLKIEVNPNQAPVYRYRDATLTLECLKDCLAAVCPVLGVHNVARARQGTIPLFEVDFTDKKSLERFCKSLNGTLENRLAQKLQPHFPFEQVEVAIKLHLIAPDGTNCPQIREVTLSNFSECFLLLKNSALFDFTKIEFGHFFAENEELEGRVLGIDDLSECLKDLKEAASSWYFVGIHLKVPYSQLEAIKRNCRDQCMECLTAMLAFWLKGARATSVAMVQALKTAGLHLLAKKIAINHGVKFHDQTTDADEFSDIDCSKRSCSKPVSELVKYFADNQITAGQPIQFLILDNLASERKSLVIEEHRHFTLTKQIGEMQKREEEMIETLEETKSSLEEVNNKIWRLRCRQDNLIRKREERESQQQSLTQLVSASGGEFVQVKGLIEEAQEAVALLSDKINKLEMKTRMLEKEAEKMQAQLMEQSFQTSELQKHMEKVQKEKHFLEQTLQEKKREFEEKVKGMMIEMKLQEEKIETAENNKQTMEQTLGLIQKENESLKEELDRVKLEQQKSQSHTTAEDAEPKDRETCFGKKMGDPSHLEHVFMEPTQTTDFEETLSQESFYSPGLRPYMAPKEEFNTQHALSRAFYRSNTPYELSQVTCSGQQPDTSYLPFQNARFNSQYHRRYKYQPLNWSLSRPADQWDPIVQQNDPSRIPAYHQYSEPCPLPAEPSQCTYCNCRQCQDDRLAHRVPYIPQHPHSNRGLKQYFSNDHCTMQYEPQYDAARNFCSTQEQYLPKQPLSQCPLPQCHPQNRPIFYQRKTTRSSASSLSPASSSNHFPFRSPSFLSSNGSDYNSGGFI